MMKMSYVAIFFFFFLGLTSIVSSQTDSCSSNFDLGLLVSFNTSTLLCSQVWTSEDFILRYTRSEPNVWDFVLSAPNPNSYVAIGFSPDGEMVGSSAIVGWISRDGTPAIKQYYLGGKRESLVRPDEGNLPLINSTAEIVSQSSRLYLGFQLNTVQPSSRIIYSIGPSNLVPLSNNLLFQHRDKQSTTFDFVNGQSSVGGGEYTTLRRGHGTLAMLGWGILLPIGASIARYFKQWDPVWFYSHSSVQGLGFVLGLIAIILGFSLEDKISASVNTHKVIGISILALGCLQVMAILIRPDTASKMRKYWNWYHYTVGRVLIALAIANVFYGISLGEVESGSWNAGYGAVLAIWFLVSIILETRMWMKK
ncbi:cytochrome b561 and DOMON domain-containing protein At3g07570-like [Aristolochia californica]|uniref:cytochrome b561 and DOMON domain-containing protein At3g07570-like n=1 Tax=Aristolochia californica TaxID=171875 RepID=UPI0035E181C6